MSYWVAVLTTVNALLLGALLVYAKKKAENLAMREDLAAMTREVEGVKIEFTRQAERLQQENRVQLTNIQLQNALLIEQSKPLTAHETLRLESRLNAKLEAFNDVLRVVVRRFAAEVISRRGEDGQIQHFGPTSESHPSEVETNMSLARFALFVTPEAVEKVKDMVGRRMTPADLGELIAIMRRELGYNDPNVAPEQFPLAISRERELLAARPESFRPKFLSDQ
jgi:hypothetical protein